MARLGALPLVRQPGDGVAVSHVLPMSSRCCSPAPRASACRTGARAHHRTAGQSRTRVLHRRYLLARPPRTAPAATACKLLDPPDGVFPGRRRSRRSVPGLVSSDSRLPGLPGHARRRRAALLVGAESVQLIERRSSDRRPAGIGAALPRPDRSWGCMVEVISGAPPDRRWGREASAGWAVRGTTAYVDPGRRPRRARCSPSAPWRATAPPSTTTSSGARSTAARSGAGDRVAGSAARPVRNTSARGAITVPACIGAASWLSCLRWRRHWPAPRRPVRTRAAGPMRGSCRRPAGLT